MRKESDSLCCLLEKALPRRRLAVKRDVLIDRLIERVRLWRQVTRYAEGNNNRVEQLRTIANELLPALERAAKQLCKIGAQQSKEDALRDPKLNLAEWNRINDELGPFPSEDWLLDLVVRNALNGVNRFAGTGPRGRPPQHGAILAIELNTVLARAGCRLEEREYLIAALSGHDGLPAIDLQAAIEIERKRDQRGTRGGPIESEYRIVCISAEAREKAAIARSGTK